ncbi:hypothetical protein F2Q70_00017566 [Brassica cretica]|uniref:Uncharacterized protein n=1 Tax=Brassica cretica TaxID=69181 RepID=A0A8S9HWP6_BRACR|nr:hypothetical protein F2Q70_00017566 [Brassica cretica]KAF2567084.1 hypothetical protein F2Q68_00025556 [Brassica cretica]
MPTLETPNSGTGANLPPTASGGDTSMREKAQDAQTYDVEDSESEPEPDKEPHDGATKAESPMVAYLEQMFTKRLDAMQFMVERLLGVAPPIWKNNPDSYADTPFTDEITLIEMLRMFSFPSIIAYDGTTDPDDNVAQYRQRGRAKLPSAKGPGGTPTRLHSPLNQENVAIPVCCIPTAISAFKRGLLSDGDLYKELTKYQCKTMEDVLSRALAQVKWEEDVASRTKMQQIPDPKTIRPDQTERDEKPSQRPARDSRNQNRGRY